MRPTREFCTRYVKSRSIRCRHGTPRIHRVDASNDAYPEGADSEALKNLLNTPLYPYQCQGALFAARAGRALIGDDMALGKTIQAIAATALLVRYFGAERLLIVCRVCLMYQ